MTFTLLSGCLDNSNTDNNIASFEGAIISTVNYDTQSSDLVAIDKEYQATENLNPQGYSDVSFSVGDESLYIINRSGQNNIVKYNQETLGETVWQYSTNNPDIENQNSNPYQVIEKSNNSAYVLRYNTAEIWQINSLAENDSEFKVSEIDLSIFDTDGIPEMVAAAIYNDILYVALQRLTFYSSDQDSYLVAINTEDNSFIDLSPNDESTNALSLNIRNPKEIDLVNNELYIAGVGRWASGDTETQYTGGIEKINLDTFATEVVIDDGNQEIHPYGQVYSVSVFGDSLVFTGYEGWKNVSAYIQSGNSDPIIFDQDLNNKDIRFAKFDTIGQLWVGIADTVNPRTVVYSKNEMGEYEVVQTVLTTLLPNNIIFK